MRAPVLGVFCEDDDDELWRRQCRINPVVDIGMRHLRDFKPQGRLGMLNLLMTFPKGKPPVPMPLLAGHRGQGRRDRRQADHPRQRRSALRR